MQVWAGSHTHHSPRRAESSQGKEDANATAEDVLEEWESKVAFNHPGSPFPEFSMFGAGSMPENM